MGVVALNRTDYLLEALEEIRNLANTKLKMARKVHRKAAKQAGKGYLATSNVMKGYADRLENEARQDLERIQKILADPALNR